MTDDGITLSEGLSDGVTVYYSEVADPTDDITVAANGWKQKSEFTSLENVKSYLIVVVSVYTFINLFSIENIITKNNINRYYDTGKIDIEYLKNNNNDNIPQLVELYKNVIEAKDIENREEVKILLEIYLDEDFIDKNSKTNSIFEYNISKEKAIKAIDTIKKK